MRFLNLTVENFGLFSGRHHFDLTPSPFDPSARVVLVRGHNGAGKSTLFKAFSLALHGPLSLGERVTAAQYQQFLYGRLHRRRSESSSKTVVAPEGRVALSFEFIRSGQPVRVRVERHWHRNGRIVEEQLNVLENGAAPAGIASTDLSHYVADLIPPGVAPLCFFDAERLETPPVGTTSREAALSRTDPLVRTALRRLLGLDLVERLQSDLDLYLARQSGSGGKVDKLRLDVLQNQKLVEQRQAKLEQMELARQDLALEEERINTAIAEQERSLAAAGGTYAARRPALQERLVQVTAEIAEVTQQVEEMCSHLLPFALAPSLCRKLSQRLAQEANLQQEAVAGELWRSRREHVATALTSGRAYQDLGLSEETKLQLTRRLLDLLSDFNDQEGNIQNEAGTANDKVANTAKIDKIIHPLSDDERDRLQDWIAKIIHAIPQQIAAVGTRLEALSEERRGIEADLDRVPDDATLNPIHEAIVTLQHELEATRQKQSEMDEQIGAIRYQRDDAERQRQKAADALEAIASDARRSELATRTRVALRSYREALLTQRIGELERMFVSRFNALCQKNRLLSAVVIDRETFSVTMQALDGHELDIASFSAGEQQLYHLSLLQALREVSGRELPLAIDTPVARLDDVHRERIIADYIPAVSEQVLLFGTDVELNESFLLAIGPNVARCYNLAYNTETQATDAQQLALPAGKI